MSATYSRTSSSTDVEASRDLTCASTSGAGISPVVAGASDHERRARPLWAKTRPEGSFRRVPFFSLPSAVPGAFVFEIALRSFFQSENMGIQNVKWVHSGLAAALSEDTVRTSD